MRVLAHIHTYNDADIIERTLDAVRRQTRSLDAVLIVDNASTDGTLDRTFPEDVTVIRNLENQGTSGTVRTGLAHGVEHGFDWVWIFDADSVPEPGALATLLALYAGWPADLQDQTGFIACLLLDQPEGTPIHGRLFTPHGRALIDPPPQSRHYMCHITVWSGCLYRMAAVRRIGLPNPDYVLDRGELEYAYRVMKAGYKAFIHQDAIILHNIRGRPGLGSERIRVGPFSFRFFDSAPIRCYYLCRNTLYFTLYDLREGRFAKVRELCRVSWRRGRGFLSGVAWQAALLTLNFAVRPRTRLPHVRACLRGAWHGVTGNIKARY